MSIQSLFVIDFASQYTPLLSRCLRELGYHAVVVPAATTAAFLQEQNAAAIILSGGPNAVYAADTLPFDTTILTLPLPIFGICYGQQLLAHHLGGKVEAGIQEYGAAELTVVAEATNKTTAYYHAFATTLKGLSPATVWMSHSDTITKLPSEFVVLAKTASTPYAVIAHQQRKLIGVQFHPEVSHTIAGQKIMAAFLTQVAKIKSQPRLLDLKTSKIASLKALVKPQDKVLVALSGGVDSAVLAALLATALPARQLICLCVDTGLLRQGEVAALVKLFAAYSQTQVRIVDASERFLTALQGIVDPEAKRKIIGRLFIEVFAEAAVAIADVTYLAQGTLCSDVIESGAPHQGGAGRQKIKSHHNVGGLPEHLPFALLEPLRDLFKDEVRALGADLGLPPVWCQRQPFPGPGLAVRVVGEVNPLRLTIVRAAHAIVEEELTLANELAKAWQSFAILLPVRAVGIKGDKRVYEETIVIRSVFSQDGMTAEIQPLAPALLTRLASRILNEVAGVGRVLYDISAKPPSTIEWE